MMSFVEDGQVDDLLVKDRDARCGKSTEDVKAARSHLQPDLPVHSGADHWKAGQGAWQSTMAQMEFRPHNA